MEPKCSLPHSVPILSQLDPVHTLTSHFLKIHLNIILLSTPGSPKLAMNKPPNLNIPANLTDIRPLLRNGAVLWWAICEHLKDTVTPLECSVFSLKNIRLISNVVVATAAEHTYVRSALCCEM